MGVLGRGWTPVSSIHRGSGLLIGDMLLAILAILALTQRQTALFFAATTAAAVVAGAGADGGAQAA
jgi:hypothetical protein